MKSVIAAVLFCGMVFWFVGFGVGLSVGYRDGKRDARRVPPPDWVCVFDEAARECRWEWRTEARGGGR